MLENQFIQFSDAIDPMSREIPIPMINGKETRIFVAEQTKKDVACSLDIITPNGSVIVKDHTTGYITSSIQMSIADISALAPYEQFRIRKRIFSEKDGEEITYSNLLCRVEDNEEMSTIKYLCYESALGFPFLSGDYLSQVLPIKIHSPQFKQSDKIYNKLSGEQVVIYATINREYEGETDYIPEEWHKKIIAALSCDEVYINGERVTKSGSYDIDWEKCDTACDGTKLARATFKVSDNIMQRNSN